MHPHGALGQGGGSGDDQAGSCVGEYGARVMGVGVGVGTTPWHPSPVTKLGSLGKGGWVEGLIPIRLFVGHTMKHCCGGYSTHTHISA